MKPHWSSSVFDLSPRANGRSAIIADAHGLGSGRYPLVVRLGAWRICSPIPPPAFLRALGGIYFSAFFSLVFQIRGLIGPEGILPAGDYLQAVAHSVGYIRGLWFAPTLRWLASGPHMLTSLCWVGMVASLLLALNVWPRGMLVVCFVCFLSFVSAAQDFSSYQSDGMLLEAGF